MSRYARRTDATHRTVVLAFRASGVICEPIQSSKAGIPDLICGLLGATHLVEVKPNTKAANGRPRKSQQDFALAWRGGSVALVRSADDVAELVGMWRRHHERSVQAAIALANGVAASTGLQEGAGIAVAGSPVRKRSAPNPIRAALAEDAKILASMAKRGDPATLVVGDSGGVNFEVKR